MARSMSKLFLMLLLLALACFLAPLFRFVRRDELSVELAADSGFAQAASVASANRRLMNVENKFSEVQSNDLDEEDYSDGEEGSEHKESIAKVSHDGLVVHCVRSHD